MTNETMSPLRRRMIEDMTIRNFGPKTHHEYIRSVRSLTVFLGRSPDTASNEDVRRFQLRLSSDGISAASMSNRFQPRPPCACKDDPAAVCECFASDGAETGGAEPHIAEQSRSWRVASGEWRV